MTEQTNTPELRFPEFNYDWDKLTLGDIGKVEMNKRIYKSQTSENEEIPFYKISTFGKEPTTFISRETFEEYKEKFPYPNKGDILISASGSIGKIIEYNGEDAYFQDSNIVWLNHNQQVSNKFLKQFYSIVDWNGIEGSTIKRLYNRHILNTIINLPLYKEQEKIGDFFNKLDRQIELEEKKLEILEQQKRGYMQKLFSQELRFKDENGNKYPNWQTVKIGSVLKERKERSGDGEMLSVTINHGIVKFDDIDRKDNSSKDKSKYKKVYKNDIAYNSMRMWQGASGKAEFDGIVSPAYTVVTPIENINSSFIAYYFKTHNMIHKFRINSQGLTSDTWNLKYKQLKDIKISICSKEEQDKIADLLTILDTRIKKQNHKLEILNINKKGLLQKMFV